MDNATIARWQAEVRACPKVWAVYVRCAGETSLDGTWESKEAAELHRDWYNKNNRGDYLGKASIGSLPICTTAMARERYSEKGEGSDHV